MGITLDDVVEAAAQGVVRALDARKSGQKILDKQPIGTAGLVRSGFFVDFRIRCGGYPFPVDQIELNPQPLPPRAESIE